MEGGGNEQKRSGGREREQTILRWCYRCSFSSISFFLSFPHHSACAAPRCPCLWTLHQLGLQVHQTNPSPPSFSSIPPQRARTTLIRWCRFTATGWPCEPLVSSLQFQNVLPNVLLFFPLSFSSFSSSQAASLMLHKLLLFPHCFCCYFTWSLTRILQISDLAAWIIPSEGLARHLTQTVKKSKEEEQLHPAQRPDTFPLKPYVMLLPYLRWEADNTVAAEHIFAVRQNTNRFKLLCRDVLLFHHFLLIKQFVFVG